MFQKYLVLNQPNPSTWHFIYIHRTIKKEQVPVHKVGANAEKLQRRLPENHVPRVQIRNPADAEDLPNDHEKPDVPVEIKNLKEREDALVEDKME